MIYGIKRLFKSRNNTPFIKPLSMLHNHSFVTLNKAVEAE